MYWNEVKTEEDLPLTGGTKAVVYHGVTAWMYYNPDSKTWHPVNGWRKNIGQKWSDVTAYMELPVYAPHFDAVVGELQTVEGFGKLVSAMQRSFRDSQAV
jgi:hypothetical protein